MTAIPENLCRVGELDTPVRRLLGAGGHRLLTVGSFSGSLSYGSVRTDQTIYVIQGLKEPLLGKPAIIELDLVQFAKSVTADTDTLWLNKYPKLFSGLGKLQHIFDINLKSDVFATSVSVPRRVSAARREPLRKELQRMVKLGVIEKVEHPTDWCSPIVVVPKKNGSIRLCIDYTKLNQAVRREFFPMPSIEEALASLGNARCFSKLDANSGYWQMPLSKKSRDITTFITPFGRFRCNRLPFGISSAPEVFHREMQRILVNCEGVICHMDDVLVFGSDTREHNRRLDKVLDTLLTAGLTLNKEKCEFNLSKVKFVGHVISSRGIEADPNKIKAIVQYPSPRSKKELLRFLGMVNYLGKFSPKISNICEHLRLLLKKDSAWYWHHSQEEAFNSLKQLMISSPLLMPFKLEKETRISTDASSYALGAAVLQKHDGDWLPVAYASRTLNAAERNYAPIEKEALAICWAVEKFHFYVAGRNFEIQTDHRPLVSILGLKEISKLPLRLQRFRLRLMSYDYTVTYTAGSQLVIADALSRIRLDPDGRSKSSSDTLVGELVAALPMSESRRANLQVACAEDTTSSLLTTYIKNGWPSFRQVPESLKKFYPGRSYLTVVDGMIFYNNRVFIPEPCRERVLKDIHEGHLGRLSALRKLDKYCGGMV